MTSDMDYRALLLKYIGHIKSQEGISFLDADYVDEFSGYFTPDERDELFRLDDEQHCATRFENWTK